MKRVALRTYSRILIVCVVTVSSAMGSTSCRSEHIKRFRKGEIIIDKIEHGYHFRNVTTSVEKGGEWVLEEAELFADDLEEIIRISLRYKPLEPKTDLLYVGGHEAILTSDSHEYPAENSRFLVVVGGSISEVPFELYFVAAKKAKVAQLLLGEEPDNPSAEVIGNVSYTKWVKFNISRIPRADVDLSQSLADEARLGRVLQPEMVRIPGGTFLMGSDSVEAYPNEKPVHRVTVSGFKIGKFEVTQAEWESVMGSNPSKFKGDPRFPVENVDWWDVVGYIHKLNAATKEDFRLPTEAEWEYACRAGTLGDRYGEVDQIAWHTANSSGRTHIVGQKTPNLFGLHDMLGNVPELCHDGYSDHTAEFGSVNPRAPSQGYRAIRGGYRDYLDSAAIILNFTVFRGGSWDSSARDTRASSRKAGMPSLAFDTGGFRLAHD